MNAERELDALLAKTLDSSYGDIPDNVLARIVELEALVSLKRQDQGIAGSYTANYLNRRVLGARPVAQPNSLFLQRTLVNALSSNSNRDRQIDEKIARLKDLIAKRLQDSHQLTADRERSPRRVRDRSRSPSPRLGWKRLRSRSPSSDGSRRKQRRQSPPNDRREGESYRREAIEISDADEPRVPRAQPLADTRAVEEKEKRGMRRIQKMKVRGRGSIGSKSDSMFPMPSSNLSASSSSSSSSSSSDDSSSAEERRRRRKKREKKRQKKIDKKKERRK